MERLSLRERILYNFIFGERLVYQYWYTRFLICGVDLDRIRRVVARVSNWFEWCSEWSKEGEALERLDRPLLVFHSGKDRLIPHGKEHADCFMEWAAGERELRFYPDGEHICANYLDEVLPYTIDWLRKHLMNA